MITLFTETTVSTGHRLPSYNGICSSPHGHNMRFVAEWHTRRFEDFKRLDALLRIATEPLDHAMILQDNDPLLQVLQDMNFRTVSMELEPCVENIATWVFEEVLRVMIEAELQEPHLLSITVHETSKYSVTYRRPE